MLPASAINAPAASPRRRRTASDPRSRPAWAAVIAFGVISAAAPLGFGAVDRVVQIGLLALLAIGLLIQPPAFAPLGPRTRRVAIAFIAVLVLKEFAPAAFFGGAQWRSVLEESYGLSFPWTHHPEPGRAVDVLLAGAAAVVWFSWGRTLAGRRENRAPLAWSLFIGVAVVALVSFVTRGTDPKAIYGLRYTPGWYGFGPFPNRNHTACLLAMGAVLGCGCVTWAGMRRKYSLLATGAVLLVLALAGLIATESRGGLVAFAAGLVIFLGLVVAKLRTRRVVSAAVAACLALAAAGMLFGGQAVGRFTAASSSVSNATRVEIWRDTLGMWRDAPVFGHGVGTFASIFPMYQRIVLDNQVVLHPESSWLQWLVEIGALPLLAIAVVLVVFVRHHARAAFERRSSFFLFAAAFAACGALLVHAVIDVPAHRWGTAAFALASLALACPLAAPGAVASSRKAALIPAGIALFWALPLFASWPAWSPLSLQRLLASVAVPVGELQKALAHFPLHAPLHEAIGLRQVRGAEAAAGEWQRHFRAAVRLTPGSWSTPVVFAQACARVSPGQSLHYWQMAIERGGFRRDEILGRALEATKSFTGAAQAWGGYVESHPELLPAYARTLPGEEGRPYFDRWWRDRALDPKTEPGPGEAKLFYAFAPRWATPAQLDAWMRRHPRLQERDHRAWATLLHAWGESGRAWEALARSIPEPAFPRPLAVSREQLEARIRLDPDNGRALQALAHLLHREGDVAGANRIILAAGRRPGAPPWFTRRAAYLLAQSGEVTEAVRLVLSER